MGTRIGPPVPGNRKNLFGRRLRELRLQRGWPVVRMVAKLQSRGWAISRESYMYIEAGTRILADAELVLALKVLGYRLADLEE